MFEPTQREILMFAKRSHAVSTVPTNGPGPVLALRDELHAYQVHPEELGLARAAGPSANDPEDGWNGQGSFFYPGRLEARDGRVRGGRPDAQQRGTHESRPQVSMG